MRCACAKKCAESKRTLHFVHLSYKTMKRLCWVQPHWQTKRQIFGPPDASRPLGQGLSGNLWCFSFMSLKQAAGSLLLSSISAAACFNFAPRSTKNCSKKGVSSQRITSCLQPKLSDFSLFHSRLSRLLAAFNSPSECLHLCVSSSATWPQRCKTPLTLP